MLRRTMPRTARTPATGASAGRAPAVSVVLCTFDRARLLPRAIRSVLAQTFADLELVVVDDGSTDDTPAVVLRLAQRDPRIVYVRHENRGLAAARNTGVALARAAWVTFLDSDDEYLPEHVAARVALSRGIDAVFGGAKLVGPRRLHYAADVDRPGRKIHITRCHIGGTLFARRDVLLALGGFSTSFGFGEDHELMARLEREHRVRTCRRRTYVYHLGGKDRLGALYLRGGEAAIDAHRARRV